MKTNFLTTHTKRCMSTQRLYKSTEWVKNISTAPVAVLTADWKTCLRAYWLLHKNPTRSPANFKIWNLSLKCVAQISRIFSCSCVFWSENFKLSQSWMGWQAARRSNGISSSGDIENSPVCDPVQPSEGESALTGGLDYMISWSLSQPQPFIYSEAETELTEIKLG